MTTNEPETAVCNACGWEGTEDDVASYGTCPACGQDQVDYFFSLADMEPTP